MMREILFRAISIKTGKWVYGHISYHAFDTAYYIHESWDISPCISEPGGSVHYEVHEVDPKTICEYTGLKDMNSIEIYENDIVRNKRGEQGMDKEFFFEREPVSFYRGGFLDFSDWHTHSDGRLNEKLWCSYDSIWRQNDCYKKFDIEVIGNMHETPELLTTKP